MIFGKVWGTTKPLIVTPLIEVHELYIKPNSFCSLHKHNYKWNAFYVMSGKLRIQVEKNDYNLIDEITLLPNDFTTVEPGEFHKFINDYEEPVFALEIYYPEGLNEDIVRKTVGGVK